jgi:hypothetical protein
MFEFGMVKLMILLLTGTFIEFDWFFLLRNIRTILKQGQRKAWHIPLPKKFDPVTLTFDLENNNISWRPISPISKPYFVKKSSNGEFLCLNAHNCTLESKDENMKIISLVFYCYFKNCTIFHLFYWAYFYM